MDRVVRREDTNCDLSFVSTRLRLYAFAPPLHSTSLAFRIRAYWACVRARVCISRVLTYFTSQPTLHTLCHTALTLSHTHAISHTRHTPPHVVSHTAHLTAYTFALSHTHAPPTHALTHVLRDTHTLSHGAHVTHVLSHALSDSLSPSHIGAQLIFCFSNTLTSPERQVSSRRDMPLFKTGHAALQASRQHLKDRAIKLTQTFVLRSGRRSRPTLARHALACRVFPTLRGSGGHG